MPRANGQTSRADPGILKGGGGGGGLEKQCPPHHTKILAGLYLQGTLHSH